MSITTSEKGLAATHDLRRWSMIRPLRHASDIHTPFGMTSMTTLAFQEMKRKLWRPVQTPQDRRHQVGFHHLERLNFHGQ